MDLTPEEAMNLYREYANEALQLMLKKNHDYDEAWRLMRVSSYTDLNGLGTPRLLDDGSVRPLPS